MKLVQKSALLPGAVLFSLVIYISHFQFKISVFNLQIFNLKNRWNLQLQSYLPNLRIFQIFLAASLHSTYHIFQVQKFFHGHFFLHVHKYVKISWKMRKLSQNVSEKIRSLRCGQCLFSVFYLFALAYSIFYQ